MATTSECLLCDHCAKPCKAPVTVITDGASRSFCCGGCKLVFEIVREARIFCETWPGGQRASLEIQ